MTHNGSEICSHLWAQGTFAFVCKINSCNICTVFSRSSVSFESSDWLEGTWKTIRGLNRLSPWTQMDQLNPLTFSLLFAFFSVVVKAMCTDQGRMARWYISALHRHAHTNTHTKASPGFSRGFSSSVCIQEFTVTLLPGPGSPIFILFISSSHTVTIRSVLNVFHSFSILLHSSVSVFIIYFVL